MAGVLGVIWILLGIFWVIRPDILRNRLKRKINRRIKFTICGFLLVFGFLIIGSVLKAPGILAKVIGLAGVLIVIKSVVLMFLKVSDKLWKWWVERPLAIFRAQGILLIIVGLMLLFV